MGATSGMRVGHVDVDGAGGVGDVDIVAVFLASRSTERSPSKRFACFSTRSFGRVGVQISHGDRNSEGATQKFDTDTTKFTERRFGLIDYCSAPSIRLCCLPPNTRFELHAGACENCRSNDATSPRIPRRTGAVIPVPKLQYGVINISGSELISRESTDRC